MTEQQPQVRLYGGWRRTRGMGLWGLSQGATVLVLGCALAPLLLGAVSLRLGLQTAVVAAAVAGATVARIGGVPLGDLLVRRVRWTLGTARGFRTLRAGALTPVEDGPRLPSDLAHLELLDAEDGRGSTFGLVHDTRSGVLTATLCCAASSTWLVDDREADGWVSSWHSWLASLGYVSCVRRVAVTVHSAPEPGTTLRDELAVRLDRDAPPDVLELMSELVQRSPAAAAHVETRVSITFDPSLMGGRLPELHDRASEASRLLAGFESQLAACGVTILGRASVGDILATVRSAYDPAVRGDVERARRVGALVPWDDAGPVAAQEEWDLYRHDSGVSVTWGWHEAPRQQVTSDVLTRLLSPGRHPKRVTLLYRPLSAGAAGRVLESQVNAAAFRDAYRRAQKRDETARDAADRERAQRAAQEEAQGAGVVLLSMYVTVTTTDLDALPEAVADVESRADQCKIQVRRLYAGQAVGFATTLPLGVWPGR